MRSPSRGAWRQGAPLSRPSVLTCVRARRGDAPVVVESTLAEPKFGITMVTRMYFVTSFPSQRGGRLGYSGTIGAPKRLGVQPCLQSSWTPPFFIMARHQVVSRSSEVVQANFQVNRLE